MECCVKRLFQIMVGCVAVACGAILVEQPFIRASGGSSADARAVRSRQLVHGKTEWRENWGKGPAADSD